MMAEYRSKYQSASIEPRTNITVSISSSTLKLVDMAAEQLDVTRSNLVDAILREWSVNRFAEVKSDALALLGIVSRARRAEAAIAEKEKSLKVLAKRVEQAEASLAKRNGELERLTEKANKSIATLERLRSHGQV